MQVEIKKVCEINTNEYKPLRAGIIPYTFQNRELSIGIGIDSKYHEFTDFSGTVNYVEENCIEGAIREFKEETLSVFKDITPLDIQNYYAICDTKLMVIFVGFNVKKDIVLDKFKKSYKTVKKSENCGFIWVEPEFFQSLITEPGKMFEKLRKTLFESNIQNPEIFKNIF